MLASQKRRLFLHTTLVMGTHAPWNCEPGKDASRQYVRNVGSTSTTATKAIKAKACCPFVPHVPPDTPRQPVDAEANVSLRSPGPKAATAPD